MTDSFVAITYNTAVDRSRRLSGDVSTSNMSADQGCPWFPEKDGFIRRVILRSALRPTYVSHFKLLRPWFAERGAILAGQDSGWMKNAIRFGFQ